MVRALARSRAFPVIAWAYLAALTVQVFFAGMFVFVGPGNIELHRNMAHVIGLLTILLIASAFVGRVPEKRLVFGILGLLVVQGMLVHLNQWFGLSVIAALHPVNALVLSYASLSLAKRSTVLDGRRTPAVTCRRGTERGSARLNDAWLAGIRAPIGGPTPVHSGAVPRGFGVLLNGSNTLAWRARTPHLPG